MILIEVEIPVLMRTYDFELDENMESGDAAREIASIVCRALQCEMEDDPGRFMLWDRDRRKNLERGFTLYESGVRNGSYLILL